MERVYLGRQQTFGFLVSFFIFFFFSFILSTSFQHVIHSSSSKSQQQLQAAIWYLSLSLSLFQTRSPRLAFRNDVTCVKIPTNTRMSTTGGSSFSGTAKTMEMTSFAERSEIPIPFLESEFSIQLKQPEGDPSQQLADEIIGYFWSVQ